MLSTLYFYKANAIYYRTSKFTEGWRFGFEEFSIYHLLNPTTRPISPILSELMLVSKDSTDRVYHLAGLIKKKESNIDWGFEEQLFAFEVQLRLEKYRESIYKQMDITRRPTFNNDYEMIDFEIEFGQKLRTFESDERLQLKVSEKIAIWFYR